MSVFISVVSHNHASVIKKLGCLNNLSSAFSVILKCNIGNETFQADNIHVIDDKSLYGAGFGANNNIVYKYCCERLGMNDDDFFIVLNPDVDIDAETISALIDRMNDDKVCFSAINLFKDYEKKVFDNSIRLFPSLFQFIVSFLGFPNSTIIDKNEIKSPMNVDWAAGSFLAFRAGHYKTLNGFDEKYFMYCEDIDICYRSSLIGVPVTYYPQFQAIHLAKHANRKIFSRHFYWHVSSVFRFLLTKMDLTKPKSIL